MSTKVQENKPLDKDLKKRIVTLDIGRGISVLIMVMVHTLWMYGTKETQSDSWVGDVLHMLGKGTAAFLILMGFSLALSTRSTFSKLTVRGIGLLAIGYGMNALKFIVPIAVFNTMPDNFIQAYGWSEPLALSQYQFLLLTGDILQLAGMSLLVIAVLLTVTKNPKIIFTMALVVAAVSSEVRGIRLDIPGVDYLLDLFFGAQFNIYFPVFPWIACILIGLAFGLQYQVYENEQKRIFSLMMKTGCLLIAVGLSLIMFDVKYHFNDFFHLGPGGLLYLVGLNCIGLWVIFYGVRLNVMNKVQPLLTWCSERVTSLYVIQWTLVCWGMGVIGYQTLSPGELLAMIPVTLSLTLGIRYLWDRFSQIYRLTWHQKYRSIKVGG